MSLAASLWGANADLAERILAHGFVRGLADGSLPIDSFKGYVAQDAYFLEAFARAYAFCLAYSTAREDIESFADLIAGVRAELELHKSYAQRWRDDRGHDALHAALRLHRPLAGCARGGAALR